jgi:carbon-monoxide dehydrogenase large subunit
MDPAEFRRQNFIQPEQFPADTPLGVSYDSGDYEGALNRALDAVGYEDLRARQERLREQGRYLGIGVSTYVEICGGAKGSIESGHLRVTSAGEVLIHTGTQDTGQGHATSYAQVAADELGVQYDDVDVVEGDTDRVPDEGGGTAGSRSLPMAGNAVRQAADRIIEKARTIAANSLEAAEADVEFSDGEFHITGAPSRSISFQEVANQAYNPSELPDDLDPGLEATTYFEPEGSTAPFGAHIAVVEVDPETGELTFERYVAVDDVGPQVNPKLVEGQIVGGITQGVGQATLEDGQYDDSGNLVTASLQDYAIPKFKNVPDVEWDSTVTPSPNNPLGVKGVGEAGTIGATPAVVNAAIDALQPFGVDRLEMPLSNETLWRAVTEADDGV